MLKLYNFWTYIYIPLPKKEFWERLGASFSKKKSRLFSWLDHDFWMEKIFEIIFLQLGNGSADDKVSFPSETLPDMSSWRMHESSKDSERVKTRRELICGNFPTTKSEVGSVGVISSYRSVNTWNYVSLSFPISHQW